ncbi:MAG TPA: PQQ-dependent sugar dehydrogenase [Chitinophagaceae bacterium]
MSKSTYATIACTVTLVFAVLLSGCVKDPKDELGAVDMKLIAEGLASPLGVQEAPDGSKRLFIHDQVGKIWIVEENGQMRPQPFLDISDKLVTLNPAFDERGLIGFAFHPDYEKNGRFFVYYQAPPNPGGPEPGVAWNNHSRIVEYRVSSNKHLADKNSESLILELNDPQGNHNGGTLAFGPDGYLYIAIGDGGRANDVAPGHVEDWYEVNAGGNGQDIEANLFGNILRIDVNSGKPYTVPASNPFVGKTGLDEIWAYGLRNPYRFSFDLKGTGKLYAGDAGQVLYEEINVIERGGNYGWNVKEGRHCFNAAVNTTTLPDCPDEDVFGNRLIDPVIELNNFQNPQGGRATTVIGGNVYRGHTIRGLHGRYVFGTFSQNPSTPDAELFVATPSHHSAWDFEELELESFPNDLGHFLKGFGEDRKGELYVTVSSMVGPGGTTGKVYKLVPGK